eukprot:7368272-Lingulodinium_polyedra.AAC.1
MPTIAVPLGRQEALRGGHRLPGLKALHLHVVRVDGGVVVLAEPFFFFARDGEDVAAGNELL